MTNPTDLKSKPTPELETLLEIIEGILEDRNDHSDSLSIGDSVEFDIRKDCVITGTISAKTPKRVKVACEKISGTYQVASKQVRPLTKEVSATSSKTTHPVLTDLNL